MSVFCISKDVVLSGRKGNGAGRWGSFVHVTLQALTTTPMTKGRKRANGPITTGHSNTARCIQAATLEMSLLHQEGDIS